MADLYAGAAILAILSFAAAGLSALLASQITKAAAVGFLVLVVGLTVTFAMTIHGQLVMARWLPFSNVIVLGNWIPIGLCAVAGTILGRPGMPLLRRSLYSVCLVVLGVLAVVDPLVGPKPVTEWQTVREGVVLQSTPASCSAAAAATLLRYTGLEGIESEMMELALTKRSGTSHLGLYRALKRKTQETHFDVEVLNSTSEELLANDKWPVLLLVGLKRGGHPDPRYVEEWGWSPGVGHAVVVFGREGADRLDVGDPAVGREAWTVDNLRDLWHGQGLRLIPRKR